MIDHPYADARPRVILVQGLPGSGKTTLAWEIKKRLNAVHINADWARSTITSHLGFKFEDRVKQATALGQMARLIQDNGQWVIVDFVCPVPQTRDAFMYHFLKRSDVYSVWMDTIEAGRFEDTNKMYKKPAEDVIDYRVGRFLTEEEFGQTADYIVRQVTAAHSTFYIRYNTHSDGVSKQWRVISAADGKETLCDSFDLRGHMIPAMTIEHDVRKWNVGVTGFASFVQDGDKLHFILKY